jgi:hypothetical protein
LLLTFQPIYLGPRETGYGLQAVTQGCQSQSRNRAARKGGCVLSTLKKGAKLSRLLFQRNLS